MNKNSVKGRPRIPGIPCFVLRDSSDARSCRDAAGTQKSRPRHPRTLPTNQSGGNSSGSEGCQGFSASSKHTHTHKTALIVRNARTAYRVFKLGNNATPQFTHPHTYTPTHTHTHTHTEPRRDSPDARADRKIRQECGDGSCNVVFLDWIGLCVCLRVFFLFIIFFF